MPPHTIHYRLKREHVAHNDELLSAVFAELQARRPEGLRYAVFKHDDGVSYTHFIAMDHEAGRPPQLESLQAFHRGIRDRCEEAPVRSSLTQIGAFGFALEAPEAVPQGPSRPPAGGADRTSS